MPLSPSRRDTIGPPPRDVTDLARIVRHQGSYLRQIDPGLLGGTRATPRPVPNVPSQLVGDDGGGAGEDISFENGDRKVAAGPGTQTFTLSHEPLDGSLHIRWNGVDQPPTEWTLDGSTVTLPDPLNLIEAGDVISAAYAYVDEDNAPDAVGFRAQTDAADHFTIPGPTVVGDFLVAAAMVPSAKTVTANGWTLAGESTAVTHATSSGTYTYRLVILTKIWDGTTTVPTISSGLPQSVTVMAAFTSGATAAALFATVGDALTASAPAGPSSVRVFGALSNTGTITPSGGTVVAYLDGFDIDITMTTDTQPDARSATSSATAGWCMATVGIYE